MKYFLLSFLLTCTVLIGSAQVQLVLTPPNPVEFSSTDVWDLSVISAQPETFNVVLTSQIKSKSGLVAELQSSKVTIGPGANVFSGSNIETERLRYSNQVLGDYETRTGHLPPGDYEYCVQIRCADDFCRKNLKIEEAFTVCMQVHVEPPTPLLLATPLDEAKLKEKRPDFTWIPPMPIGSDPELTYQFTLVELRENQSPSGAIRRNRPIYSEQSINGIILPFPGELNDLEVGKSYAWQVVAYLGNHLIQSSEVWEFEIVEEKTKVIPMPYVKLKKGDASIYNAVGELKFIYEERQLKNQIAFKIIDHNGDNRNSEGFQLQSVLGENKFKLDLARFQLDENETYRLEITQINGETYSLKFRYYLPN